MKFEIINGKMTGKKPLNEKKRKVKSQEAPIEIDNFDYPHPQLPQLPTIKDILKIIRGNIYVVNDKIDFIVQHFILDQPQLL